MEDCLEMVDALNALLSPGERELCEELMSSCDIPDFRCFHCPTRCDTEMDMLRHCDQAHPYYETKYHLPSSFGSPSSTLIVDEYRWMCCSCPVVCRTRQEVEAHCVNYHRSSTRRLFYIDRTNSLKMSLTVDRSFLQQPPLAPTPPQDSSDILFHDLASTEGELDKLSTQATQMAVMALANPSQPTNFTALPPISSLLQPQSMLSSQSSYPRQDLYYGSSSGFGQPCLIDGESCDLASSPSSSTYSENNSVDFNNYHQPLERYTYSPHTLPRYGTMSPNDMDLNCGLLRTKNTDEAPSAITEVRGYTELPNSLMPATSHTGVERFNSVQGADVISVAEIAHSSKSRRGAKTLKKAATKKSRTPKLKVEPYHELITCCAGGSTSNCSSTSAQQMQKSDRINNSVSSLLTLAGPLSAKRKRIHDAVTRIAAPASVKDALRRIDIDLHLNTLPAVSSGSERTSRDLESLLETNLKTHERAFIHIAGCKLKVRDYASVVDIHPIVQLTDVLRNGIK